MDWDSYQKHVEIPAVNMRLNEDVVCLVTAVEDLWHQADVVAGMSITRQGVKPLVFGLLAAVGELVLLVHESVYLNRAVSNGRYLQSVGRILEVVAVMATKENLPLSVIMNSSGNGTTGLYPLSLTVFCEKLRLVVRLLPFALEEAAVASLEPVGSNV